MGAELLVQIRPEPFDPWHEVSRYQLDSDLVSGSYGACTTFVGTMRDMNLGDPVSSMELEHYEGMTQKLLCEYAEGVIARHGLLELMVLHRVGRIFPSDPIVLVAVWSEHRSAAFDGCRDMMEYLKLKATFWKREDLQDSDVSRWVDNATAT